MKVVAMAISRRVFLVRSGQAAGLVAASGALGGFLEAAAGPAGASPAKKSLTAVTYQLGWLANVENAGEFVADTRGYFKDEGIKITLLPGGPTTTVEPEVISGKCLVGLSETDTTARAIDQGGHLKTIAATLQSTPLGVCSLASKPYLTPKSLYGKKLGIQSFQVEVFKAFYKMIGLDWSKINVIPATGDPSILSSGEVDALSVLVTNEPITLALKGIKTHVWTLGQHGWSVFGDTLEVATKSLNNTKERDLLVHVVRAVARGWQNALADPTPATAMVVDHYGKNLDLNSKQQLLSLKAFKSMIETPYTKAHGLLKMSEADIEVNLKSIRSEGIKVSKSALFDTTVLADAYNGATRIN
jgi:ABC-type nitrate/sulfonate/bicarbonate transport system substrate-binding protein